MTQKLDDEDKLRFLRDDCIKKARKRLKNDKKWQKSVEKGFYKSFIK